MKRITCIVCDPPWSFSDKLKHSDTKRGAEANYSTMSLDQLKALPIKEIADPSGAILCLWVPSSLLPQGLELMEAYGFQFKQTYVWAKTKKDPFPQVKKTFAALKSSFASKTKWQAFKNSFNGAIDQLSVSQCLGFGMGRLFRNSHEMVLVGINNNGIYKKLANKSQRTVSFAPITKHSAKPEDLQDSLDLMFSGCQKLEIFARRSRPNWLCLGNQSPDSMGEDIMVSLNKLL